MFKEAFVGIIILFLFYLAYRLLWKRRRKAAVIVAAIILPAACAANIIYNSIVMFPDYYMDTVGGRFRYGTFSENLFAYSDEFMFRDNILFPILRNRSVALDESAQFYSKFFTLYSGSCETAEISDTQRKAVLSHKDDFSFSHEFSCIGIMDYAANEIPAELSDNFEEEIYTWVYINTASLKGQSELRAVMDDDYTVYLMSEAYYQEITGGTTDV